MCNRHYLANRKYGNPHESHKRPIAMCSISDCESPVKGHDLCSRHWQRWRYWGDPLQRPMYGQHKRVADPGYLAVHKRVARMRGSAKTHTCQCGASASQWAYDNADPEVVTATHLGYRARYSLDESHYVAMCVPCHVAFDREARLDRD